VCESQPFEFVGKEIEKLRDFLSQIFLSSGGVSGNMREGVRRRRGSS